MIPFTDVICAAARTLDLTDAKFHDLGVMLGSEQSHIDLGARTNFGEHGAWITEKLLTLTLISGLLPSRAGGFGPKPPVRQGRPMCG